MPAIHCTSSICITFTRSTYSSVSVVATGWKADNLFFDSGSLNRPLRLIMGPTQPLIPVVDCVCSVMAHAQKPDFVFRWNGRVHLNRRWRQFSRPLAAEVCASGLVKLDTPRSEVVKGTGYPLHSPVSPSLPLPCVTACHQISTGLYRQGRGLFQSAQRPSLASI